MKIILKKDIAHVGKRGDIKEVKDGFALNFLIPQKFAVERTRETLLQEETAKKYIVQELKKTNEAFQLFARQFSDKTLIIRKRADDKGHLYAALSTKDVITAIYALDATGKHIITETMVMFVSHPIKTLGGHVVAIKSAFGSFDIPIVVERER